MFEMLSLTSSLIYAPRSLTSQLPPQTLSPSLTLSLLEVGIKGWDQRKEDKPQENKDACGELFFLTLLLPLAALMTRKGASH